MLKLPKFNELDFVLILLFALLLALGVVMIASVTLDQAAILKGNPFYHLKRHLIYLIVGGVAFFMALLIPINWWNKHCPTLIVVSLVMLILAITPGIRSEGGSAYRWIHLGFFNVQPSEFAKVFSMVFLAGYLVRRAQEIRESYIGFFKPFIVLLPVSALIIIEPDFGATFVLMMSALILMFLGGVDLIRFSLLGLFGFVMVCILIIMEPYRLLRFTSHLNPWEDPFGAGYQLTQSLIAFGRGEIWGLGLGNSVQKQFYLPEAHTDFIFAILAEELGLVGALLCMFLLLVFCIRIFFIGVNALEKGYLFGAYFAYGLAALFSCQILISIGVNVGVLPTKGLTLPFISYGGSSLVTCCLCVGILLRIEWETRYARQLLNSNHNLKYQNEVEHQYE